MDNDADHQRARQANYEKQDARRGWGSSQRAGRKYLAAIEHQVEVLKDIRRVTGEGALHGQVSAGIEALERDAANVRAEIPTLPDI
jgi:hypothetical protein